MKEMDVKKHKTSLAAVKIMRPGSCSKLLYLPQKQFNNCKVSSLPDIVTFPDCRIKMSAVT